MTLGEKIRCARKCIGISQGQLADKMCVSRSAVAKWETDKGLPDVENLKLLARLICVSVDRLLDDENPEAPLLIRETCCLDAFGPGCAKMKKDRLMRKKFPDARIRFLAGRPELTDGKVCMDPVRGFLTEDPQGNLEYLKDMRNTDRAFYLVDREDSQCFVTVKTGLLEIIPLSERRTTNPFRMGSWTFRCIEEL